MQIYIWVSLILFLAGFTQGLSGFGSIFLSIPLLAFFLEIKTVIPLVALAALAMTLVLVIQLRAHLDWKKIYPLLIGAALGIPVGVALLRGLDKGMVQWILGSILVAYAIYGLFSRIGEKSLGKKWGYPFGFLAGCMGGFMSATSPPVIVFITLQGWSKDQMKATLQGFFLVSGLMVVFSQILGGLTTLTVLRFFAVALPSLLAGTYVGSVFYGAIREESYRRIMMILLVFLGGLMIYRA
jgi:uncharacterized membrane protein YfcA